MKNIIFASRSAPFVADSIARLYGSHFFRWSKLLKLIKNKGIGRNYNLFIVGLYYKDKTAFHDYSMLTSYFNKVVIVFSGTDVLQLRVSRERRRLFKMLENKGVVFASVGESLQQEVKRAFALDSKVLSLPSPHRFPEGIPQFPKIFSVGCYLPPASKDFYGIDVVKSSAELDRTIFYNLYSLTGGTRNDYGLSKFGDKNIIVHTKKIESRDMTDFISSMKCGLRMTKHDGHPMSIAEYIMMGRYFVFNNDMPYCDVVKSKDPKSIVSVLQDIKRRDKLNIAGANHYRAQHLPEVFEKKVKALYR